MIPNAKPLYYVLPIHFAAMHGKSSKEGNQKVSGAVDEGKWAGGDPPFPICGGGGREFFIIINSDVGWYGN